MPRPTMPGWRVHRAHAPRLADTLLVLGGGALVVAATVAPGAEHIQLMADLTTLGVAGTPHGIAPLLDPTWDEPTLQAALAEHGL